MFCTHPQCFQIGGKQQLLFHFWPIFKRKEKNKSAVRYKDIKQYKKYENNTEVLQWNHNREKIRDRGSEIPVLFPARCVVLGKSQRAMFWTSHTRNQLLTKCFCFASQSMQLTVNYGSSLDVGLLMYGFAVRSRSSVWLHLLNKAKKKALTAVTMMFLRFSLISEHLHRSWKMWSAK